MRPARLALALALLLAGSGCSWTSLAWNSATYPTSARGEARNVAAHGELAYAALGEAGIEVLEISSRKRLALLPPPRGSESADDLSLADGLLFVLDARSPGHLSVYSLARPEAPALVSGPVPVPVGPFSGVSAGGGRVVVSGGTSELTVRLYDGGGRLGREAATADLGRGQPDVRLSPDGRLAFVSTHYSGPRFGLDVLRIEAPPRPPERLGGVPLEGAGFTSGGAKPANFPIQSALAGDILLVAHGAGLSLVDVRDPASPKLLRVMTLEVKPVHLAREGDVAAVVGSSPRPLVVLLDVQDPRSPAVTRTIALPEGTLATGVALTPTHVVVAGHAKGLLVFERP